MASPAAAGGGARSDAPRVRTLIAQLGKLRREMLRSEAAFGERLNEIHPTYRVSARNLVHYIAFRRRDIRRIQKQLAALGLSSLGRSEAAVLATFNGVITNLHRLGEIPEKHRGRHPPPVDSDDGRHLLQHHTHALLGPRPSRRFVRIMVTMPPEAADDYALVREMVRHGMECARVNCAHDGPAAWERMIANARRAAAECGRRVVVLMDLAGPKLRTGPIEPGPQVVKWRPQRDLFGRVTGPARIWLVPPGSVDVPPVAVDATLTLPAAWLEGLSPGDLVSFKDARGAARSIRVTVAHGACRVAESTRTTYLSCGTALSAGRGRRARSSAMSCGATVGDLPHLPQVITLRPGDTLLLTRSLEPGRPARVSARGRVLEPARIGCTLPEVFRDVRRGEKIWFDDGKIGGVVAKVCEDHLAVTVTRAKREGSRLQSEKGINLPDTTLRIPALTEKDARDVAFVAAHADMVGLSFVRSVRDVRDLQWRLAAAGNERLGILLKIETRKAFEMLPELILAAMRNPASGIMIARGDLAVECGYERLAEVQEEILWVCEAAHMPVVWATQVLESLAKKGIPSRAEITDAAMSERAECVMLNKGPYILEAIALLDDILRRMEAHQHKKRAMLRRLHWWTRVQRRIETL